MTLERMTLSCQEVEELAGAYALGALSPDEQTAVEEHLASCRLSDHAELRELSETAAWLPLIVPAAEPPDDLGARIVSAALAERTNAGGAPPAAIVSFRPRRLPAVAFALTAAAMALIAIGLGAWGLSQRNALVAARQAQQRQAAVLALLDQGGTALQTPATSAVPAALLLEPKTPGPAFLLASWPSPPTGRAYQAWYIAQGRPVSAAVFGGSPAGLQVVQLAPPVSGMQAFAVTLEPAGGSAQPTTEPLFVRPLTSS